MNARGRISFVAIHYCFSVAYSYIIMLGWCTYGYDLYNKMIGSDEDDDDDDDC